MSKRELDSINCLKDEELVSGLEPFVEPMKAAGFRCGSCGTLNELKAKDAVRCRLCGHRILYKERPRRPIVTIAR